MKIGIDIVEIKRISKLLKNDRFLKRVFTQQEIDYSKQKRNQAQHFAVRFATKEAVWKALGRKDITYRDISVKNLPNGKPQIYIRGSLKKNIDVSLSHADFYAIAVAIVR